MDITPDGTFEKSFSINYPMRLKFKSSGESKVGFLMTTNQIGNINIGTNSLPYR